MIAPLAKLMDWSAIQAVTLMMPAEPNDWRLEEALEFLKGPGFVTADSQPAQVEFNGHLDFRFPTPRPCNFTENNVVHGRFYRCGERWRERPVVIRQANPIKQRVLTNSPQMNTVCKPDSEHSQISKNIVI
jgi:hypothetical protein